MSRIDPTGNNARNPMSARIAVMILIAFAAEWRESDANPSVQLLENRTRCLANCYTYDSKVKNATKRSNAPIFARLVQFDSPKIRATTRPLVLLLAENENRRRSLVLVAFVERKTRSTKRGAAQNSLIAFLRPSAVRVRRWNVPFVLFFPRRRPTTLTSAATTTGSA